MAITSADDFKIGEFFIPNNDNGNVVPPNTSPNATSAVIIAIEKYEPLLLLNALNVTLYKELEGALVDLPSADQKWGDLVNGKDYIVDSKEYRWEGLKNVLIPFIYTNYLRNDQSTYTTTGIIKSKAANADNYDPNPKYIKAYNTFLTSYQGEKTNNTPSLLVNRNGVYGLDYYSSSASPIVSLYQYLTDQNAITPTDFPDFDFRFYEQQNSLGI